MRNGFVFSLVMALIIAIFAIQNSAVIPIKFLFAQVQISLAIIIILSAVIGAVITVVMGIKKERDIKKKNKDLVKKIQELERTNEDLLNKLEKFKIEAKKDLSNDEVALDKEDIK